MLFGRKPTALPDPSDALAGRASTMTVPEHHFVNGRPLAGPIPEGFEELIVGMGCFWGAERAFWPLSGVWTTAVGYSAGFTPNPTYEEVCSGRTGHNEVVRIVFDPTVITVDEVLRTFWEGHDPTQGMAQGNDVGTQYRSGIYTTTDAQATAAAASRDRFATMLATAGFGAITTELVAATAFYYAEDYHQQYLAKNPGGYCGLGGTGLSCPIGIAEVG